MFEWVKSKKLVFLALTMVFALGVMGCGGAKDAQQSSGSGEANGKLSGEVQIAGSTSVQPLSEELATQFMELNPDVKIDVAGGGSSAGVKAANEGTANIGASSRELKDEEKSMGLTETVIAKDGIAIIVNANNSLTGLNMEQAKKIFTGEINNWKQLGGKDAPITVINREEGSGTRGAFEELVLGKDAKFTDKAAIQNSTGAVRTAIEQDENSIGYISMGSVNDKVKALKVDGVEPKEADVLNGTYKISRPFIYLTKGTPDAATKAFIDWVLGSEGQKIVGEEFVAVK